MNALTICQPYAHLIAEGNKRVENRKWWHRYRGPVAIHAGKSREFLDLDDQDMDGSGYHVREMAFGAVVAISEILDCLPIVDIRAGRYDDKYPWLKNHLHTEGPFCFVLGETLKLKNPIKVNGALGLWSWRIDKEVLARSMWESQEQQRRQFRRFCQALGFAHTNFSADCDVLKENV